MKNKCLMGNNSINMQGSSFKVICWTRYRTDEWTDR